MLRTLSRRLALPKHAPPLSSEPTRRAIHLGFRSGSGRGGAGGGQSFKFYVWPWLAAVGMGSVTLNLANYMQSDELYQKVVLELGRRDGLRTLQLMIMTFGGRWTEEVRTKLARNGCVESLIPMQIRLNSELKEAADRLEQVCMSCNVELAARDCVTVDLAWQAHQAYLALHACVTVDLAWQAHQVGVQGERLAGLQEAVASAFSRREVCSQAIAIIIDSDVGRQRFFLHKSHAQIVASVLSSSDTVDWSALTNTYRASQTQGRGPANSATPPSMVKGLWGSRKNKPQDQDDDAPNPRPWTASEALLVASLAGDERGQEAIFSSEIALATIEAVLQEGAPNAAAPWRRQGSDGRPVTSEDREAALNRHNDRARQLALLKAVAHLARSSLPQVRHRCGAMFALGPQPLAAQRQQRGPATWRLFLCFLPHFHDSCPAFVAVRDQS